MCVLAGWQTGATLSRTPAFNKTLRVPAVTGGTQPALVSSMYHQGEYLYQIAHDWRAMAAEEVLTAGLEHLPPPDVLRQRSRQARAALLASLRVDPANAYAWTLLAVTEYGLDNPEEALAALETSQSFAPYDPRLAFRRLLLLGQVASNPDPGDADRALFAPHIVDPNVDILTRYYPPGRGVLSAAYPALAGVFD